MKQYEILVEDEKYGVYERPTDQIIGQYTKEGDAKRLMKHCNGGGGFNGFTPRFFTQSTKK